MGRCSKEADHLARHDFVWDAGQARDLGRNWSARLLQATINPMISPMVPAASNVNATAPISMISSLRWLRPVVSVSRIPPLGGNPGRATAATYELELSRDAIAAGLPESPHNIVLAQFTQRVALLHRRTSALAGLL